MVLVILLGGERQIPEWQRQSRAFRTESFHNVGDHTLQDGLGTGVFLPGIIKDCQVVECE